jgi:hypothetical protein
MPSIREAIEALADGLRNRRAADGSAYECGLQNQAQSVAHLLLDILAAHPELPREELRKALEKIIEWCDGTRGADFDTAPFEAIGDCARAALSRPAKAADLLYPPVLMTDEERYRNYLESLPSMQPPAKPPTPQSVTMTQPPIDFVLGLSQAEADRLGPPAPKRWRCETCGKLVGDDELCEPDADYGEFYHLDIRGMPCGPVEMEK